MNSGLKLYRRRFIPNETVLLKDDLILSASNDFIITKWNCLKQRQDIARGYSAYDLKNGYKISKIYDHDNQLVYWYCDVITSNYDSSSHSLIVTDLLVDILVFPDGSTKVLDLDELSDALEADLLPPSLCALALRTVQSLLNTIQSGGFSSYQQLLTQFEQNSDNTP